MADLSQIPTETLLQAYNSPKANLSSMPTEDLMRMAGMKSGAVNNLAAGANENISNYLGLPAKVANAVLTAPAHYAVRALADNVIDPMLGLPKRTEAEWAQQYEKTRLGGEPQDINSLMGKAGFDPRNVQANTPTEKFARGFGRGITDAAATFMPARVASMAAPEGSLTKAVADTLAAQPVTQAVSTGIGEGTTDATGNPLYGLGASALTAGGMAAGKNLLDRAAAKTSLINSAPTTAELKGEGGALFNAAKGTDATISKDSFSGFVNGMKNTLDQEGADQMLHPKVTAAVNAIARRDGIEPTVGNMMTARRLLGVAANSAEPDERRIASNLIDGLDRYMENLKPGDMASGNMGEAASQLSAGRDLWTRMRKSEMIQGIIDKAQNQASGPENGLRIGFRQLLNRITDGKERGFSQDEVKAISDVANGTFTSNTLRRLGSIGFGSGVQKNVVGGSIGASGGAYLGSVLGGPIGAAIGGVAGPAVGYAAQKGAQASTQRAADYARAIVASGGGPKANPMMGLGLLAGQRPAITPGLLSQIAAEQQMGRVRGLLAPQPQ